MKRIKDEVNRDFVTIDGRETVRAARKYAKTMRCVVVTGSGGSPVGLLDTTSLQHLADGLPLSSAARKTGPIVVVPEDLSVADAVRWPAFNDFNPRGPGVVVVRDQTVSGIWLSDAVSNAFLTYSSSPRTGQDWIAQGTIGIPRLTHQCGFEEGVVECLDSRSFRSKPDRMPECRNPRKLLRHDFVW